MRIAIPVSEGKLAAHFDQCARFALIDVDLKAKAISSWREIEAPEHPPGLFPRWLADQGAQLIIAGGIGISAQILFTQDGIEVRTGASAQTPEALVVAYMEGTLYGGENLCDQRT